MSQVTIFACILQPLTPTYNNNHNSNIQTFIQELPIIKTFQKENPYATIVGDFYINLLQMNEIEKFDEFSM